MGTATIETSEWSRVKVVSISADQMSAYHIREFVKALDKAKISDSALIEARRAVDTQRFNGLSVRISEKMEDFRSADE